MKLIRLAAALMALACCSALPGIAMAQASIGVINNGTSTPAYSMPIAYSSGTIMDFRPYGTVVLTCTVAALKVFAPVYVLTRGGPESSTLVPSYYSYLNFFVKSKVGYGAAIATVLTIVILIVAIAIQVLQNRSARRDEEGR